MIRKVVPVLTACLLLGIFFSIARAAADVANPGDIAFTGFNADGSGSLAFALLVDAPAGVEIHFTDKDWNGSYFQSSGGEVVWTAPPGGLTIGTVVVITDAHTADISTNYGSVVMIGEFSIAKSRDTIYAFLGPLSGPTAFLSAISNSLSYDYRPILDHTGMTSGDIIVIPNDADIMGYTGLRDNLSTATEYQAQINNPTNWTTQEGSGVSVDGEPPDYDFDDTPFTTPTAIHLSRLSGKSPVGSVSLLTGVVVIFGLMLVVGLRKA